MRNVVPFAAPAKFAEFGIDWKRAARTETERRLREAFLTYETSCGPNGLVSILSSLMIAFESPRTCRVKRSRESITNSSTFSDG